MTTLNFDEDEVYKKLVESEKLRSTKQVVGIIAYALFRQKCDVFLSKRPQRSPEDYRNAVDAYGNDDSLEEFRVAAQNILSDFAKDFSRKGFFWGSVWPSIVASFVFSFLLFIGALCIRLSNPDSGIGIVIQYLLSDGEFEIKPKMTPSAQPSSNNP